jgi:hypothetical protein
MSYCRFGYHSDVYCYDNGDEFIISIARYRHVSPEPFPEMMPDWHKADPQDVLAIIQDQEEWYRHAAMEPINLGWDGKTFGAKTTKAAVARMEAIREKGYRVPQEAIDALLEDVTD